MQIFLAVFAVASIAGAWAGWRRSPLYSGKATLKIVGIFLLIVAGVAGASMAIVNGPVSRSPTAQAILAATVILAIGTGATGLIIRTTDAHVAQLPSTARIVTTERHRVQRWIWRTVVYLVISAVAGLVLPSSWSWLPLALGSLVLLGCGPMLMALYMRAKRLDLGMSAVIAAPWVHWQYTPEEWDRWARQQLDWELTHMTTFYWRRDWRKARVAVIVFAAGAVVLPYGGLGERMGVFAGTSALLAIMGSSVNRLNRFNCGWNFRHLLAAPREVYFGGEGVFCNGRYSQWIFSGSYLLEATVPHDAPACLQLVFQSFNGASSTRETKRIPIPPGGESDLATLQQKLRSCCPKASVHL